MKIEYRSGTNELRITTETTDDLIKLGAISQRFGLPTYKVAHNNPEHCVDISLGDVLRVLTGEKK